MNPWQERVENSPARQNAEQLRDAIAALDLGTYDAGIRAQLERIQVVAETVLDKLSNTDPRLINNSALAQIGSGLTSASTYLTSWLAGGQPDTQLTNYVQSELDSVTSILPNLSPGQDVSEARESITRLRRSVAANITAADRLIDQLKARGSEADISIEERVSAAKAEFEKLDTDITALDTELKSIRTSSQAVSTEQTSAFTKAEAERAARFTELLEKNQKDLATKLQDLEKQAGDSINQIKQNVDKDRDSVAKSKAEVERILQIVGEESLIGDYSKTGKLERKFAEGRAVAAFISVFIVVGVAAQFAHEVAKSLSHQNVSWQFMLAKTVLILSFGALAGYAARQSSEHRSAQRESERMALQLSALPAYTNNVGSPDLRDKLLIALAEKMFGPKDPLLGKSKKENNPLVVSQLAEALLEAVKQIGRH